MLPSHIAENIKKQVLFYLQSTFFFRDSEVEKAFNRFLLDPETGIFKGPWIQVRQVGDVHKIITSYDQIVHRIVP